MDRISRTPLLVRVRVAGACYLLTFVTGSLAFGLTGPLAIWGDAAGLIATAFYVAVVVLFYDLFRVVSAPVSALAAFVGLVGCSVGALTAFHFAPFDINSLVFFGFYCLLIGYLILRSTFMPRVLGVLMALAGLGWLTFASPSLAHDLQPINVIPGLVGEGSVTIWLLARGVNVAQWRDQGGLATEVA